MLRFVGPLIFVHSPAHGSGSFSCPLQCRGPASAAGPDILPRCTTIEARGIDLAVPARLEEIKDLLRIVEVAHEGLFITVANCHGTEDHIDRSCSGMPLQLITA